MVWIGVGLAACGSDDGKGGDSGDAGSNDELLAIAADLETAVADHSSWGQVASWMGVQPSDTAHDEFTQVWLNGDALSTIEAGTGEDLPVGSILFKQSYSDAAGSTPTGTTAMYKVDAEYGWFWASWDASGELKQYGQPDMCTGCHTAGQDSVLVTTW